MYSLGRLQAYRTANSIRNTAPSACEDVGPLVRVIGVLRLVLIYT